jgi:hypothetical protein
LAEAKSSYSCEGLSSDSRFQSEALNTRLARERTWTKKFSSTVQCEEIFQELELDQFLPRLEEDPTYIHTLRLEMPRYKKDANKMVQDMVLKKAQLQSKDLVMGGEFSRLLEEQNSSVEWRSLIHSLPRGLLGFAARLTTNSLPSPDNLARWKKLVTPRCPLCDKVPCTLFHLLSNCRVSLDQGRYDYRHDSVLAFLYSVVRRARNESIVISRAPG